MTDQALVERLRALSATWRGSERQALQWADEHEAKHDGANAHAFRKERRIWRTCADELDALLTAAGQEPPCPECGNEVRDHRGILVCRCPDTKRAGQEGAAPYPQSTEDKTAGLLGSAASGNPTNPPSTPSSEPCVEAVLEKITRWLTSPPAWDNNADKIGAAALLRESADVLRAKRAICAWCMDDIGGDSVWETACKNTFYFEGDGTAGPLDAGFTVCPYCGNRLVEQRTSDDEDEGK